MKSIMSSSQLFQHGRRMNAHAHLVIVAMLLSIMGCQPSGRQPSPIEEAKVRAGFSTEPIKITIEDTNKTYIFPRNYMAPNMALAPYEKVVSKFGFTLFLPAYTGFTIDMADIYPRPSKIEDMVHVLRVHPVAKSIMQGGKEVPLEPAAWGDPKAMFENTTRNRRLELYLEENGLQCYGKSAWRGLGNTLPCIGTRSNGELIYMKVTDPPRREGLPYFCDVRYFSEREQLYIEYHFFRDQLAKWREIDDAIWAKLHSWQVK